MPPTITLKKLCLSAILTVALISSGRPNLLVAQTEAEAGPSLASHLKADDTQYQSIVGNTIKDHSFNMKMADTYENKIISQNIVDCGFLISVVRAISMMV